MSNTKDFVKALQVGRPPNVAQLFPHSRALIVSGKAIDRAMLAKGKAMTIAANARNVFIVRGVLKAAQRANAAVIIEIAKSEGGAGAYCAVSSWNLATFVDACANELGVTVPVAVHADHYGIKGDADVEKARVEIPSMFEAGTTSIAIDASHMTDDKNLLASIELNKYVPAWAGLETEQGEIKGKDGLSNKEEALFLIQGLNAHGISPDWIALNNGTTHGIEASDAGIQVGLTAEIHQAVAPYKVSGAQHGTSGNSQRAAAAHRRRDAHDEGQRRHGAADDLLGRQGQRLRQRRAGRERRVHQGPGPRRDRGGLGEDGRPSRRRRAGRRATTRSSTCPSRTSCSASRARCASGWRRRSRSSRTTCSTTSSTRATRRRWRSRRS